MKDTTLFQFSSDLHDYSDLGMYYCGKRVKTLNHSYGPEIRNYYLFVLVNEGEATFFHKNGVIRLKKHDLLVMCPGEKIHYIAETPWSIQWVGLYGQTVEKYMRLLSIDGEDPIVKVEEYDDMETLLDDLYEMMGDRSEYSRCRQIALIYQFFSLLLRNSSKKSVVDIPESAKRIIDYNFDKNITVKDISNMLYLSPEYLTRQFSEKYNVSPKEYLIEKRIAFAKKMLTESTACISEISNSVGYEDQLYFSRIFKKKTGLSPLEFRKQAH
jgi:AraC family transcriptional regulator of arabinose operon